jgi:AN1-like Zinc finger
MAEFGAVRCDYEGCRLCDFLPCKCSACGLSFCDEHRSLSGHACSEAEAYLARSGAAFDTETVQAATTATAAASSQHPLSSQRASDILRAVTTRFAAEDNLSVDRAHYGERIRTTADVEREQQKAAAADAGLHKARLAVQRAKSAQVLHNF